MAFGEFDTLFPWMAGKKEMAVLRRCRVLVLRPRCVVHRAELSSPLPLRRRPHISPDSERRESRDYDDDDNDDIGKRRREERKYNRGEDIWGDDC